MAASRISMKTGNSAGSTGYGSGDITISNSDIVVGDSQGTLVFKTGINDQRVPGKLTLSGNTIVAAGLIDFCGVGGDIVIEPSVWLSATTIKVAGHYSVRRALSVGDAAKLGRA